MDRPNHTNHFADLFTGISTHVPLLDGSFGTYTNLDNAASTPPLKSVMETVNRFIPYYSSVHRGTGFKSQLSTHAFEASRNTVLKFLGADPTEFTCIFGKNTTEAINKLSRRFPFTGKRNIVLTSGLEHHSNDLPWRAVAKTIHIGLTSDGQLDEADFDRLLNLYANQIALVSISGASNVTGFITPVHRLAEKTHKIGAQILVDCAQLAPHRRISMLSLDHPAHLDYVAISAHKLYAPFGTGALVGRIDTFNEGDPDLVGGGTVEIVTLDEVVWTSPPERDEAGSPNTVGAIALAAAIHELKKIGMETVAEHESELTAYILEKIQSVEGVYLFGNTDPSQASSRVGVIPFGLQGLSHFKVASILGYEFGIGVRSGCFCAHPYILHLLGLTPQQENGVRQKILSGDRSDVPGLVRASFGLYNSLDDIDTFINALHKISRNEYRGIYVQDPSTGEYRPQNWEPEYENFFSF
jgi:cysteine desulfurase / selenocysteine lyase